MPLTDDQRQEIAAAFEPLIGLPLVDMFRYGCQKFVFGDPNIRIGWSILACRTWRILGPDGFTLGAEHFEPDRRDDHASAFYERQATDPLLVVAVQADAKGGIRLNLTEDFSREIHRGAKRSGEIWHLMPPETDPRGMLEFAEGRIAWHSTWDTPIATL